MGPESRLLVDGARDDELIKSFKLYHDREIS